MESRQALGDVQHVESGKKAGMAVRAAKERTKDKVSQRKQAACCMERGAGPMAKAGPSKVGTV